MLVAFAWGMSRGITPAMHLLSERADNLVIFSRMDAVDKACDAHDTLGAKSANDLPMMELPSGGRVPSVLVAAGATHESSNWDVGSVLCVARSLIMIHLVGRCYNSMVCFMGVAIPPKHIR